MNYTDFAQKVRDKYPGSYDSVDDKTLAEKVIAKYPEYSSQVEFNEAPSEGPGVLKSGALGVMSGIPGAETAVSGLQALSPDTTYEEAHQNLENLKNQAWEEHPVAYGAGKTAGIVGTGVVAPASIPAAVGIGALSGLDVAEKPEEMVSGATKGAVLGGAFGAAGKYLVEPAVGAVVNKIAPAVGKRAVASLGKPTLEDVESYLKNPEAIRNALTNPQMAEKLASTIGEVGEKTGEMSTAARGLLNPENAPITTPDALTSIFDNLKSRYLQNGVPKSAGAEAAINALDAQYGRLQKIAEASGGKLDETALKEQIVELQNVARKAFTDDNITSTSKDALKNLSGALNGILKEANPAYGEAMVPVAEQTGLTKDIVNKFSLEPTDTGYAPTEATVTKVSNILKENKTESQDLLQKLQDLTGIDFLDLARKAKTSQNFEKEGSSQGLNVIAHAGGYGLGALSNIPGGRLVGSLLGGVVGHNIDGGQVAKKILDAYISGSTNFAKSGTKQALAKYGPVLVNAAKAGGNQLAATHFVLGTSDPHYQELTNDMESQ